jgi:hypothetical protein
MPPIRRTYVPDSPHSRTAQPGWNARGLSAKDNSRLRFALIVSLVSVLIPAAATAQPWILSRSSDVPSSPTLSLVGLFLGSESPAHNPDRLFWEGRRSDWAEALELAAARARREARERARLRAAQAAAVARSYQPPPPTQRGSGRADWYAIAQCESGGRWNINSSNGFWGGLQFLPSTWFGYGGGPFDGKGPFPYSAAQQIAVAERVLAGQGPGAWPNCFQWA